MAERKPIISFRNFSFQYRAQKRPTLTDINLEIYPGERVLIAGPSGSGKSTLAGCINGLNPFSNPGECTGTLTVDGVDAPHSSLFELSAHVGTVLQDPDGQFIGLTVGEDIAFALENSCTPQDEMHAITRHAAELVGIENHLGYAPHELSGGQKQRVSLAGVMVDQVKILLFDEPLANLDPATGKRYTLEEVYQSKNVILSNGSDQRCNFTGDKDPEVLKWQHEMAERAPFNAEMQAYADKVKASLDVPENMDLIGIAMRGSDLNKRFYGHAVQLTADEAVPLLQDRLQCWKKSGRELGVFVKSEEQTALDLIASKFDNVFYSDSVRFKLGESDHVNRSSDLTDKSSKYENTQQYLGDIYLLSQCDCIISTMNNGYYTAIIWNGGKFSHLETIDKGRYK